MLSLLSTLLLSFTSINNTQNNIDFINNHSKDLPYKVDINQFINREYVNEFYNNTMKIIQTNNNNTDKLDNIVNVPHSIDWRKHNAVSSVKNQLECGSCWAFSAAESVEGAWSIKHNKLYNLSEQELIDCSESYGNQGCDGGSMDLAFKYIIDNGLCDNISYPYIAQSNYQCNNNTCNKVVKLKNYKDIHKNNEHILKKATSINPISVAIQANKRSFQLYDSGIYNDSECGYDLDHGVLVVGYGYDELYDLDYWIVKNSWGNKWGENGYIRIERNINDSRGLCGIAMDASYPIV